MKIKFYLNKNIYISLTNSERLKNIQYLKRESLDCAHPAYLILMVLECNRNKQEQMNPLITYMKHNYGV
jgi:hypothetical protein